MAAIARAYRVCLSMITLYLNLHRMFCMPSAEFWHLFAFRERLSFTPLNLVCHECLLPTWIKSCGTFLRLKIIILSYQHTCILRFNCVNVPALCLVYSPRYSLGMRNRFLSSGPRRRKTISCFRHAANSLELAPRHVRWLERMKIYWKASEVSW